MAAGVSLAAGKADELRKRLNENCTLTEDDLTEKVKIDIPLPVGFVTEALVEEIDRLEPFGVANPRPLFAEKDVPVRSMSLLGANRNLLKIMLEGKDPSGNTKVCEAVCFNNAEELYNEIQARKSLSVIYQPSINEYQGRRSVQLIIKDLK